MKGTHATSGIQSPSTAFAVDRVCSADGCHTRLSVYNAADRCWQHDDVVFPTFRGKRTSAN